MASPRTIKRYTNRKLYDTLESRYVTLDDIARMVRAGDDVRVVDNASGNDLTVPTLAQIIFEEQRRSATLALDGLRRVIQTGTV